MTPFLTAHFLLFKEAYMALKIRRDTKRQFDDQTSVQMKS